VPAAPQTATAAADTAGKAVKAGPGDVAACAAGRVADFAINGCTRLIEDKRTKPKGRAGAYFNRGNAWATKGEPDKAIADFDEAIKLDPKNASAYNNRGNAHSDKGETDAAIADFDAAIKANARYASAYFNRGNAYAAQGERERAIKEYDAAIKYNRRNVNAYIARGALLLAGGATPKALADMRQAALGRKNAYAVLWLDIAEKRAKQKGVLVNAKNARGLDMKAWPAPVVRLFTGELKADALMAEADNPSASVKAGQVCEANFYGGEHALIGGDRAEAVKLFQAAAKDCPRGFLEGIAAAEELKGLGEKVGAN
jgi:lipoprotein NlpI